jgi:hypothetical protein
MQNNSGYSEGIQEQGMPIMTFANISLKATAAALLLLSLAACSGPVSSADMSDYSYVPATGNATVSTAPGIEAF